MGFNTFQNRRSCSVDFSQPGAIPYLQLSASSSGLSFLRTPSALGKRKPRRRRRRTDTRKFAIQEAPAVNKASPPRADPPCLRYQLLDEAGLAVVGRKFRRTGQCFVGAEALTTTAESLISALLINWPPVHDSTVTRVLLTLKPGLVRKSARVASPAHFSVEH